MTKWRPGFNSRCRIGIGILSMNELITVEILKNGDIGGAKVRQGLISGCPLNLEALQMNWLIVVSDLKVGTNL